MSNLPIAQLLKEFASAETCKAYSTDGKKIELITEYLWLRQLTPDLTFEVFLQRFTAVADYDEENRKHPKDAIALRCPRSKVKADKLGIAQWTAKQVVRFTSLYIDMIREAELEGIDVPMTFDQCCAALGPQFLAGAFDVDEPPAPKTRATKAKAQVQNVIRPTAIGQPIIYTAGGNEASGKQRRGVVTAIKESTAGKTYITFTDSDNQESVEDVAVEHCRLSSDDPADPAQVTTEASSDTILAETTQILVGEPVLTQVRSSMPLKEPLTSVSLGDTIYPNAAVFASGYEATIDVINGETGPFVDARFFHRSAPDVILCELPPREDNLFGDYNFEYEGNIYQVVVKPHE